MGWEELAPADWVMSGWHLQEGSGQAEGKECFV